MSLLVLDVFSDPVCPWCYIGYRRLQRALASYSQPLAPQWRWRCFQLNPGMPATGMDRQAYLAAKFGGDQRASLIYQQIRQAGEEEQIAFQFDAIQRTPNTMMAHRLIRWLQQQGQDASPFVEALFKSYFLLGQDIGSPKVLFRNLALLGYDAELAQQTLETPALAQQLTQDLHDEEQQARTMGVTGVPFYLIGQRYALSGAQSPQAFHHIIDAVLQRDRSNTANSSQEGRQA